MLMAMIDTPDIIKEKYIDSHSSLELNCSDGTSASKIFRVLK